MTQSFNQLVEQMHPQVVSWRRHLHKSPELSFNEINTAQFVFDTLCSFPNLIVTRPTKTSVMARLIGKHPGKTLAIRADMDALALQESNDFEYKSQNDGVMHACGHDGHTASLLGTAKIISNMQDQIKGEIRFLFQHAEEVSPGGAVQMIANGVMIGVDMVIGIHFWAPMPLGKVGVIAGPMMASPDHFDIEIIGHGGHGGYPHQAIDAIAIGAQVVSNLQHIVSRNINPTDLAVVSITKFISGTTHNILPSVALIAGTVRTFDPQVRKQIRNKIEQITNGIVSAHGARYQFDYANGYNPVINHPDVAALLEQVITEDLGPSWVDKMQPSMAGEDFSAYLEKAPGCYLFVGAGNAAKGIIYPHHHPLFQIDEDALDVSMRIFLGTIARVVL